MSETTPPRRVAAHAGDSPPASPRSSRGSRRAGLERTSLAALAGIAALVACSCGSRGATTDDVAAGAPLRRAERYAHSIAALAWPGATRAFQVGDGSVIATGETALEWTLVADGDPVETSPVWFERDGVPVAHWEVVAPGQRVRFEAAAAPHSVLGDTSLVATVIATAEALGDAPVEIVIEARVRALPEGPHFVAWDAPPRWSFEEYWQGKAAYRNGLLVAIVDDAAALAPDAPSRDRPARFEGTGRGRLGARCVARLAPGETRRWQFVMPVYPSASEPRAFADATHERIVATSRRHWRQWLERATRLASGDTLLDIAWRAALVNLIQCHERQNGRWIPIGNPFQYRDVWIRDAARSVRALAAAGLAELAADDARTLAEFQLPSGVLISQRGQLDGSGQALWAFEQASALANDAALARELLPVAAGALDWIDRQRQATRELQLAFSGLLPFGDPRDAELVRAQLVGNDAWAIAGVDAVAALAGRAGDRPLAARAAASAADYRATFEAALGRVRHPDVPPSWQGVGRDWGNVAVAYPTRVLTFDDRRVAAMASRLREGAPVWRFGQARRGHAGRDARPLTGLTAYGPPDSLHSYYGGDLAQTSLLAGRPEEARAWLSGLLAHSSSTLGQAEIFHAGNGGFGANLPPHTTASAMFVDLVRNMVVCDVSDTLAIALGADPAWWTNGLRFENAPTRFGPVTLRLAADDDVRIVTLDRAPAALRVRVPSGVHAIEALSEGARIVDGRWVDAQTGVTTVRFRVATARGIGS